MRAHSWKNDFVLLVKSASAVSVDVASIIQMRCIRDMTNLYEKDEEPYYVLTEKELYELYAEEPELDEEILKQMLPDGMKISKKMERCENTSPFVYRCSKMIKDALSRSPELAFGLL